MVQSPLGEAYIGGHDFTPAHAGSTDPVRVFFYCLHGDDTDDMADMGDINDTVDAAGHG
jgi:hypothetical protein